MPLLTREQIITALKTALEPLPYTYAMWEGGAAAFERIDEWSDIDLQVDADDDRVADVVAVTEEVLAGLSPFKLRYELPQPAWHGHAQVFYQFENASPFLLLDFVVIKHTASEKFIQPEIHGEAVVHFDKVGVVKPPPFDAAENQAKIQNRLAALRVLFPLFQTLTLKEVYRHNAIEAMAFYTGYTLRPLLEVLRMRYCPNRYQFFTRYVYYDLPHEVVQQLEPLYFVKDAEELLAKREQAERMFNETLAALEKH